MSLFIVLGFTNNPKPGQHFSTTSCEDPQTVKVRKEMGWDWMQEKRGSLWPSIIDPNPLHSPILKLFTTTEIRAIGNPDFYGDIDYYFLDALRTYIFNPGGNPIGEIHNYQTNDAVRKDYGDFLMNFHDDAFWKLSITATIDDRGADLNQCKGGLDFINANGPVYIKVAQQAFKKGEDVKAMFALMYPQRHNMDACTWFRGTYREKRAEFIALVNSY